MTAQVLQQIGRYRVTAKLGAGGMGTVYRAYDEKLQRDVAIKLLNRQPDASGRSQILHEARASSALNHPGICTVYEVEDQGDQSFIVMEMVEGRSLSDLIPRDGFPFESVRSYGLQVADALAHAHARGVIHRDVKPSNILVTPQGRIKVLDFGLGTHVGLSESWTGQRSRTRQRPKAAHWRGRWHTCRPSSCAANAQPPAATSGRSAWCFTSSPPDIARMRRHPVHVERIDPGGSPKTAAGSSTGRSEEGRVSMPG